MTLRKTAFGVPGLPTLTGDRWVYVSTACPKCRTPALVASPWKGRVTTVRLECSCGGRIQVTATNGPR